jgi:amino acid transporter
MTPKGDNSKSPTPTEEPLGNVSILDLPAALWRRLIGRPKSVQDPHVFHQLSLIALLAWVGLGADGLSSSSYGPEAMFRALGNQPWLAVFLAAASAFTVVIISWAYSRIIERFPFGGGGYVVATKLLGKSAGVVSGSALIVDYVLTITTSIAAGADAIFSLPMFAPWAHLKLAIELGIIGLLVVMNLRGVRESVTVLAPIFLLFLVTHAVLVGGVLVVFGQELPAVSREVGSGWSSALGSPLGLFGVLALFLRAYSSGAGTYTGIEAVSNGLMIMREPRVATAKRTMLLMAVSLALTAGGITLCYLLVHAQYVEGKTMNAVLVERFTAGWGAGGGVFVFLTLIAEALLLFVAAQAGFIDGPRVMANMATDSWLPHRFAQLSDRLTMQNGVLLMGGTSVAALLYTGGDVTHLVDMYAINVFITFSLSQAAMIRYWLQERKTPIPADVKPAHSWRNQLAVHGIGLLLCFTILIVNVVEKFKEGGWVTLAVTAAVVTLCFLIRQHYEHVRRSLRNLDDVLTAMPSEPAQVVPPLQPNAPTAVLLVGGYGGLGVHSLLSVQRLFPHHFKNFVFVSVGVIDSASFNSKEVEEVRQRTKGHLDEYLALAQRLGIAAATRMAVGTEAVAEVEKLASEVGREFPRSIFFAGKLVFQKERWYQRLLHNESAYQLQRRLQFAGLDAMVLPVRVLQSA